MALLNAMLLVIASKYNKFYGYYLSKNEYVVEFLHLERLFT